jgi:DNA polymerase-3 subunit delta'
MPAVDYPNFKNIVGQTQIISALRRASANGAVNHSYIFTGERGMGKKTIAGAFAKSLQCEAPRGGEACGTCRSCRLFGENRHPDVFYVKGTKTKSIVVDDVREQVKHPMQSKPFQYRYKIFIVDEAETLTAQAQNALLKIIEEPLAYGLFIFLAASLHTMLPTVLSRCVVYKFKPLTDEEVRRALARKNITPGNLSLARGNVGKAMEMALSNGCMEMAALAEETARTVRGADILSVMAFYHRFEAFKGSIQILLDMLYMEYIKRAVSGGASYRHAAQAISMPFHSAAETVQCVDAVTAAKKALERNVNFQLTIELMLLQLNGGTYDRSWCAI